MRRFVIIGSGVAGIAAVESIRSLDSSSDILMISDEPEGFYSRPGVAYYLTGEIPSSQLFPYKREDYSRLKLRILHALAVQVDPRAHQVKLKNKETLPYDRLLIATGSLATRLDVPGNTSRGVVKLDTIRDARGILRCLHKRRSAVIVGNGITALEIVEGLVAHRAKTHLLLRGDRIWGKVLDENESRIVKDRLEEDGVQIHYRTQLAEILTQNQQVVGVRTLNSKELKPDTIQCELVAIATGVQPRKDLAVTAGLSTDRGVLVNKYLQTSDPDIFAAGDVAQVFDPLTGYSDMQSLWRPAREQGSVAGSNMAGQSRSYVRSIPLNVLRMVKIPIMIIGAIGDGSSLESTGNTPQLAHGDSEAWHRLPEGLVIRVDCRSNHLRLLIGEQTLVGAVLMGDQTLALPLQHMITHRVDISPIRNQLLENCAPISSLLMDYWNQYRKGRKDVPKKP